MSLLKFYDFTPIEEQPTRRMPKITARLPVVAGETPLPVIPIIYNAPHSPVYRLWIDGEMQPVTRDIHGVDLLVGRSLRNGAHDIEVYEDYTRLYEVHNL